MAMQAAAHGTTPAVRRCTAVPPALCLKLSGSRAPGAAVLWDYPRCHRAPLGFPKLHSSAPLCEELIKVLKPCTAVLKREPSHS